jgi:protein required for attachment to host cells
MDRFIHPDARVLVCDGRKALFLRNDGPAGKPQLSVERELHGPMAARTADLGTDRPGRISQRFAQGSAIDGVDLHMADEEAFLRDTLSEFTAHCDRSGVKEIVLIAPPKALAVLRRAGTKALFEKVVGEIDKDLTKHTVDDIARSLIA